MQKKPTDELNDILENMRPDQLDSYLKDNSKYMADNKKAFYYYMKDVLDEKNIKLKDVYSFAGVSESYGSKIVTMEKHTKDRDLIIRLCLAGHFNWDETNRALKLYGMTELYAKDPRDACIIVAINNRIFDQYEIDDLLTKQGLKKITADEQ
ncbi:hypothetical protein SAMN04487770_11948 [Butyrivibrio sp. ob235]|uniref:hypothetical protein n=1 Tax=Butyrivibrio sp. ob235 TaxID=1761780 RepID=UPI0008AF7CC0|nr:hypothetical protein [Butyrivibrio sp. ob235]SEL86094.1 hypothetical protein SAMN04487770_11948 [Butyrivibrio sp. ob235]